MTTHLPKAPIALAALVLLTAASHALAAGLDCDRASGEVQTTICASESLRRADARLASVYGRLMQAQPGQRSALRQSQLNWLTERDRCAANDGCLQSKYAERLGVLQTQLREALAYQPDATDRQALEDMRQAVEAARKTDPEFPLERVLDRLRIQSGMTTFENVSGQDGSGDARFPTVRPAGVSADEWRALLASKIDGGGENGMASYILLPIDDRAKRDLVIRSYSGGTGMYTVTSVLRRNGDKFEGGYVSNQTDGAADDTGVSEFLAENGRGANQSVDWIRLRGRVYAAYRNSVYGQDDLYLIRPLSVAGKVPKLTVRYRYKLSVPKVQKDGETGVVTTLDEAQHAALTRALTKVDHEVARDIGDQKAPHCPPPPNATDDERNSYYSYGTGHYTFEIVGDMPIWMGGACYMGRMVDWFGAYSPTDGLLSQIWMRKPQDHEQEAQFSVRGTRAVTRVEAAVARFKEAGL